MRRAGAASSGRWQLEDVPLEDETQVWWHGSALQIGSEKWRQWDPAIGRMGHRGTAGRVADGRDWGGEEAEEAGMKRRNGVFLLGR